MKFLESDACDEVDKVSKWSMIEIRDHARFQVPDQSFRVKIWSV